MGFCTRRYVFLTICVIQLICVAERQVFDFLGFFWIPILVNFFELIFIIFGFFGAYQYRTKYVFAYTIWHVFWLAWNVFIICLYMNVAGLDHETNQVLKFDCNSQSFWKEKGPGCNTKIIDSSPPTICHISNVENCLIDYVYIEVFQSGLQCFLTICGVVLSLFVSHTFMEEDDTSSHKGGRKGAKRMSLYSIEFSSQEGRHQDSDSNEFDHVPAAVSPKPMTPRRVKRRSVMTRGSSGRHSTSSRRQHVRSSTRSSRRMAQNPVTQLLEQQRKSAIYENTSSPIDALPNYFLASQSSLITQNWQPAGHANPSYQQSSTQSLNDHEDFDELYNNRPASVRSSYSNFHGTRAISYSPPKNYQHSHATPQVPQKRANPARSSMRSMAFLNNGPPAYTSHGQTSVDSETTI